jgi:hypothetical protein
MNHQPIENALSLNELKFPESPRVVGLEWKIDEDWSGEDSLYIVVVLDDDTSDRDLEKAPIHKFKSTVIESLSKHGVKLFPYIFFDRQSEHEALAKDA